MFKLAKPFFILCESPLHCGTGSDLGHVDQPIQRERHTGIPKIESSSLKGALRESFEGLKELSLNGVKHTNRDLLRQAVDLSFGSEKGDHAGALGFSDARLLLFPVKSMKGVFAWITCPRVLNRFISELSLCGDDPKLDLPKSISAPEDCRLYVHGNKIVLEEYTFEVDATPEEKEKCSKLAGWLARHIIPGDFVFSYWKEKMERDIVVLSDDDFCDFVNMSTEVITRTKIDNKTGTVESGALFTEEYLPVESVLYALALASPVFNLDKGVFKQEKVEEETLVMSYFKENLPAVFQLGGNASIGKGLVRTRMPEVTQIG